MMLSEKLEASGEMTRSKLHHKLFKLAFKENLIKKLEGFEEIIDTSMLSKVEKFPSHSFTIDVELHLNNLMEAFVETEDYELAARARDCIKELR
jgi:galactose-1-phosphate uridylyltransferase